MKKYLWLFLTALCSYIFYFFSLPPSTPYTPPPLPVQEQLVILEIYQNHRRVPLEELYEKAMSRSRGKRSSA